MTNHKSFGKLIVDENVVDKVVFRPCNVDSIKKGLEEGSIKSVQEFYNGFMLMLVNIVMSNSSESEVRFWIQSPSDYRDTQLFETSNYRICMCLDAI